MTPYAHAACGLALAWLTRPPHHPPQWAGWLIGSVLPDLDFVLLVPLLGRQMGHRTITHAPAFQVGMAWLLRRYGFWAVLGGQLVHSLADSCGHGNPRGVAWFVPFHWNRVDVISPLMSLVRGHNPRISHR